MFGHEPWFGGCGVSCFGEDAKLELRVLAEHYETFIHLYEWESFPINVTVVGKLSPRKES